MKYEVTKEFKFEMAHVLSNYDGPCGNLHGHSYRCLMSFTCTETKLGCGGQQEMVIDFSEVKRKVGGIIDSLDHCFAYNNNTKDPFEKELIDVCKRHHKKVYGFNGRTTAEHMSKVIFNYAQQILIGTPIQCSKVQLFETATGNCVYGG